MKRINKIAVLLFAFVCTFRYVYADPVVFDFSLSNASLSISGNMGKDNSGSKINVKVYETANKQNVNEFFGSENEDVSEFDNVFYNIIQSSANLDGEYEFADFELARGKKYTVEVTSEFNNDKYEYTVYSPLAKEVTDFINVVKTGKESEISKMINDEKKGILSPDASKCEIGVNMQYAALLNSDYIDLLAETLKKSFKTEYTDVDKFNEYFTDTSFVVYLASESDNDLLKYVDYQNESNSDISDSEYELAKKNLNLEAISDKSAYKKFVKMTSDEKASVCKVLATIDFYDTNSFYDAFNLSVVRAQVENAKFWTDISGIIDAHKDVLTGVKLGTSDYNETVNKAIAQLDSKTVSEYVDSINNIIADKPEKSESGSNKKGSGGFVGASGSNTIAPIDTQPDVDTTPDEAKLPFNDTDDVKWAHTAILDLYKKGVISGRGNGTFEPNAYVTRAEFVKMIIGGMKFNVSDSEKKEMSFSDVKDEWYYDSVSTAYSLGIINGINDNEFGVSQNITREDMAVIIYRALNVKNLQIKDAECGLSDFDLTSEYAKTAVSALYGADIVKGDDKKMFNPKNNLTRAEAASVIYNVIQYN